MPRYHRAKLYRSKLGDDPVDLLYIEESLTKAQARFLSRTVLTPQIDLSGYQCRAMVDWIDVRISLGRATQHQWINRLVEETMGGKSYVKPIDAGPGAAALNFQIRFQEPDFTVVRRVLQVIDHEFGFPTAPAVSGIEVSVDFYPREPSEEARARLHGVLVRHFFPTTRILLSNLTWPRFMPGLVKATDYTVSRNISDDSLDVGARMSPGMDRAPLYGSTYYVGQRNDRRAFWRIQNKVVDRQNLAAGTFEELPEEKKRIRIEVALGDKGCREIGLILLEDIRSISFARFQKNFFQFMKPTFSLVSAGRASKTPLAVREKQEDFRRQRFLNAGVLGLQIREDAARELRQINLSTIRQRHRLAGTRMPPANRRGAGDYGTMIAYGELTRLVERALADLERRVRGR
jgi:hypothetical protein